MFTGLIEAVGEVVALQPAPTGFRLSVGTSLAAELAVGHSLAVNGVCLTVATRDDAVAHADVSPETARVTALGQLRPGALVNLERPLRADGRVGGHFVQGHVDATGSIEAIERDGDAWRLTVTYPPSLASSVVRKGSIAVDGISLTIASADERRFEVQIIPYTWQHTNLRVARPTDRVNLEADILGKYVLRALELAGHERIGRL
jgi:riboflavin synthase